MYIWVYTHEENRDVNQCLFFFFFFFFGGGGGGEGFLFCNYKVAKHLENQIRKKASEPPASRSRTSDLRMSDCQVRQ